MPVYRVTGTAISWAGARKYRRDELVINPPEFVETKLSHKLERLDDDGVFDNSELKHLRYQDLQKIAAAADDDGIDGNSTRAEIVEALS